MTLTPEIGGGETVDVIRDVTFTRRAVNPFIAWHASRTALRYAFQADFLPFAETLVEYNNSSRIVSVGVYSPFVYADRRSTIIGNPREVNRSKSFVMALKALHRSFGGDFSESKYAQIMVDLNETGRGMHPDKQTYIRSFLQLEGYRKVDFIDPTVESAKDGSATIVLNPGDAYSMQFQNDDTTILHAVEYTGTPYSVGLYVNHWSD